LQVTVGGRDGGGHRAVARRQDGPTGVGVGVVEDQRTTGVAVTGVAAGHGQGPGAAALADAPVEVDHDVESIESGVVGQGNRSGEDRGITREDGGAVEVDRVAEGLWVVVGLEKAAREGDWPRAEVATALIDDGTRVDEGA